MFQQRRHLSQQIHVKVGRQNTNQDQVPDFHDPACQLTNHTGIIKRICHRLTHTEILITNASNGNERELNPGRGLAQFFAEILRRSLLLGKTPSWVYQFGFYLQVF